MKTISSSDLILNADGSVYHLKLLPQDIADIILLVGDPGRVGVVSNNFDKIEVEKENREFKTRTGYVGKKRITVLSTGIGTDNMDIVLNELDALANIDLKSKMVRKVKKSLTLIRIGTSGAIQHDIPADSFVASTYGLGFDGLLSYYSSKYIPDQDLLSEIKKHLEWDNEHNFLYLSPATQSLLGQIGYDMIKGITATAPGFYGPQGRTLRLTPAIKDLPHKLSTFRSGRHRITNFEMETSALYGLGSMLGHKVLTVCAIIANRLLEESSKDYKATVEKLIRIVLERI